MIGFDTNILVYAVDATADRRHRLSSRALAIAFNRQEAVIPLLVLAQFYSLARRKLAIRAEKAQIMVDTWRVAASVEPFDERDLAAAMSAHAAHGLHIWDALIWATCDRVGATILATEDLQDGRTLGRVTFLDPFNPANAARLGLA